MLDLGCSPGSWLQYARQQIGDHAVLVGLDRTPLTSPPPGARIVVGDVHTIDIKQLTGDLPAFDVVLSDMAPDTSGIRNMDQARSEALFEREPAYLLEPLEPDQVKVQGVAPEHDALAVENPDGRRGIVDQRLPERIGGGRVPGGAGRGRGHLVLAGPTSSGWSAWRAWREAARWVRRP